MTTLAREAATVPMTYEEYLAEGEVMARYDIIDGVREFMTNPTRRHQRILLNLARHLQQYEVASGRGQCLVSPQDVLITRVPLRTRQPDVLFIRHDQLPKCAPERDPQPLLAAPELVVEILSPGETRRSRAAKLQDYCSVGVRECWIVDPKQETIEVLRLTSQGPETVAAYSKGTAASSVVFTGLAADVVDVFAA